MKYDKVVENIKNGISLRDEATAIICAKQLLKSLDINSYPVPIVEILNDLGFVVLAQEQISENISGYIMVDMRLIERIGKDRVISIDINDNLGRQRFTMAHEFGHFLFDFNEENLRYFNTYNILRSDDPEERVPSRFAAEFLMPEEMFKKRFSELKKESNYIKVRTLVQDFQVSEKSVLRRFEELGMTGCEQSTN